MGSGGSALLPRAGTDAAPVGRDGFEPARHARGRTTPIPLVSRIFSLPFLVAALCGCAFADARAVSDGLSTAAGGDDAERRWSERHRSPRSRPPTTEAPTRIWRPAPGTSWQWQLSGVIDTTVDVEMYDIDLFDTPRATIDALHADGRVVICYFSAGSVEDWRPDADAFPVRVLGRSNGWPGERWLDVRALDVLMSIMEARLDLAREKGCDGVEPDNVDGYANVSGFPLSATDQLSFNIALAGAARARGLSVGLKNDLDQVSELEPHFDWALNEQCVQYRECERLLPFVAAGKAVFGVEYEGEPADFCRRANELDLDWLDKDLDLGARRVACR